MKTSWSDGELIENYIFGKLPAEESLLFEARLLTNPLLKWSVTVQKKVYKLVRLYHHKKLKEEVEAVHQLLFSDPDKSEFQKKIRQLFKQ